jgi:hypothetical protein
MTPPSSPGDTPPGSPPRSTSPVEATLIDALPESPTAAVPVRSEIATPAAAARPIRRSVALRLRYKECNGDLAGGSFVELAKTLADGLTFSDRVQFARVVTQPLLVEAEAIIGRRAFPRGGPLWFVRRRGVIIDVPEGAVAGSRAIVSLPDDGSARHATVTIAFPPGLSTGQELTVALEV